MLKFDPCVGRMAKRNFHDLEVLDSPEQTDMLPRKLLEDDAIGGRVAHSQDDPSVVVLGRLAFYLADKPGADWRIIPYELIVDTAYGEGKVEKPTRLDIILAGGEVERLYTSELSGILGIIHRKAKNYRWSVKPSADTNLPP